MSKRSDRRKQLKNNISKEVNKLDGGNNFDPRFWNIENRGVDEIYRFRFMADKNGEMMLPYRRHKIEYTDDAGRKKKVSFVCPKSLDKNAECPVCETAWSTYWIKKDEKFNATWKNERSNLLPNSPMTVTNIFMLDDPQHPEHNNKVHLFNINGKLIDMVKDQLNPSETTKKRPNYEEFNPFDEWYSADFYLQYLKPILVDIEKNNTITEHTYCISDYKRELFEKGIKGGIPTEDDINELLGEWLLSLSTDKVKQTVVSKKLTMESEFGSAVNETPETEPEKKQSPPDTSKRRGSSKQETVEDDNKPVDETFENPVDNTSSDDVDALLNEFED